MARAPIPSKPWTNLGCPPEELTEFLGALLRGQDSRLAEHVKKSGPTISAAIEMLVARHRTGPYLWRRLQDSPVMAALPAQSQERLRDSGERQRQATEHSLDHLRQIEGILRSVQCPFLLLKGPEAGLRFFGAPDARGYRDIDVLVREQDREMVCRTLCQNHYTMLSRAFLGQRLASVFNHGFDFARDGNLLDLHWCVSRTPGIRIATSALFDRAEPLDLAGIPVRVLAPEDELVVLLISAFADIQQGYLRLQSLVDIAGVVDAVPEVRWPHFFAARQVEETDVICRVMLALLVSLLGLESRFSRLLPFLGELPVKNAALAILLPSSFGRRAKAWATHYMPSGRLHYLAWWTVSLPFRVAANHHAFRRSPHEARVTPSKSSSADRL